METVVIIQMLSQLLPTIINVLMHYEELVKNGSEQDKEKMKMYLDTLKWKSWDELVKDGIYEANPTIVETTTEPKKEVENAPAPANTNTAAAN